MPHLRLPRALWLCMDMCAGFVGVCGAAVLALATLTACSTPMELGAHSLQLGAPPKCIGAGIATGGNEKGGVERQNRCVLTWCWLSCGGIGAAAAAAQPYAAGGAAHPAAAPGIAAPATAAGAAAWASVKLNCGGGLDGAV